MKSGTSTSCQSETCPHPIDFVTSSHITLDYPVGCTVEQNIVLKALESWLHPCTTRCGRKFPDHHKVHYILKMNHLMTMPMHMYHGIVQVKGHTLLE